MTAVYIALILVTVLLAAAYGVYRFVFYSPNRTQNTDLNLPVSEQLEPLSGTIKDMIRALAALPFETVQTVSRDGLTLRGGYYHNRDGAPLAILFHGYRGTPCRDFSGGARAYLDMGFNLLMIRQRAHCDSQGHSITFGVREREDALCWTDWALGRFGKATDIVLCGISMGAATVLMASELPLPANVKGIVADCPYISPKEIIMKVCRDMKLPARPLWPLVWLAARLFARFDPNAADAARAVTRTPVPVLLIHGEDDRFVPCDMGRRIADANPRMVELHTFPDAGHGLSFLIDKPRYERLTRGFFARVLGPDKPGPD
ncbi:MAG: alpha/beta hydrolase [Clostridiales bacterium]|nr:alpha/beta hydrolase [Clostridiales bacterium]